MDDLHRAAERIDDLKSTIGRINKEAQGVDLPLEALEVGDQIVESGIPVLVVSACQNAIQAMLDALNTVDGRVDRLTAGRPPKWWRELHDIVRDPRHEYATTHPALVDAFEVLDGHVREDNVGLGLLIFLVERVEFKIERVCTTQGFRPFGDPYPDRIDFLFNPQIDNDIDQSLRELLREVLSLPKHCASILTDALDDVRDIVNHFGLQNM